MCFVESNSLNYSTVLFCMAISNLDKQSDIHEVIIIIIKISDASPSGKNRTFTKLQSSPTSTSATEKKENGR